LGGEWCQFYLTTDSLKASPPASTAPLDGTFLTLPPQGYAWWVVEPSQGDTLLKIWKEQRGAQDGVLAVSAFKLDGDSVQLGELELTAPCGRVGWVPDATQSVSRGGGGVGFGYAMPYLWLLCASYLACLMFADRFWRTLHRAANLCGRISVHKRQKMGLTSDNTLGSIVCRGAVVLPVWLLYSASPAHLAHGDP
jgi:hypothetical protein